MSKDHSICLARIVQGATPQAAVKADMCMAGIKQSSRHQDVMLLVARKNGPSGVPAWR